MTRVGTPTSECHGLEIFLMRPTSVDVPIGVLREGEGRGIKNEKWRGIITLQIIVKVIFTVRGGQYVAQPQPMFGNQYYRSSQTHVRVGLCKEIGKKRQSNLENR